MKIFSWVQRRLISNKDVLAQNGKKSGAAADENNEYVLQNTFDGWRGGILSIGTFGYDPLKDESELNDPVSFDDEEPEEQRVFVENEADHDQDGTEPEENEDEDEDEETNPLVYAAYVHDSEGLLEMKMEEKRAEFELKKGRTTLAELFYADNNSEELQKKESAKKGEMIRDKSNTHKNNGFSFAKKIIGDDARPIHKLQRLMRRMMKRKIHPEVDVNKDKPSNSTNIIIVDKLVNKASESASLLPTPDTIV